ncbi:MAG: glycosyltransferase [Planctomycetes bacterium]|nr:glycosyltransferase [Planctomycetota bacterium]
MPQLHKGKATICIVNYKTLDFTRLCLRSIRKFTTYPYEIIVVDNDSRDESLEYLKSLSWIKLLERKNTNDPSGGYAHSYALDLAFENCSTEYFVSMHSDTFIKKQGWLTKMVSYIDNDPNVFSVGTGKIELTPLWREILKKTFDFKTFKRKLLQVPDPVGKYRYYNRTICCLYRTAIIRKENLDFTTGREIGLTAGKKLHFDLADKGYSFVKLCPKKLGEYVIHLAHATQAINASEFTLRKKTVNKCERFIKKIMSDGVVKSILEDNSLDK